MGGNLSPNNCGWTRTDFNHSGTDRQRFTNSCHLIYKHRGVALILNHSVLMSATRLQHVSSQQVSICGGISEFLFQICEMLFEF